MKDNQNIELEPSIQDNNEAEQSQTQDNEADNQVKQEEKAKDLSKFNSKPEPKANEKEDARQKARDWIITSFVQKVATGEVELDAVPEWVKWDVKSQFESIAQPATPTSPSISEDEIKTQLKEELKFEMDLEATTKDLDQESIDLLHSEFSKLSQYWMPKTEALRLAKIQLWEVKQPVKADLPPAWKWNQKTDSKILTVAQFDALPWNKKKEYMAQSIKDYWEFKLNQ